MKAPKSPLEGYTICDIHTNPRFPGIVYASLKNPAGEIITWATLDYIVQKVKALSLKQEKQNAVPNQQSA